MQLGFGLGFASKGSSHSPSGITIGGNFISINNQEITIGA